MERLAYVNQNIEEKVSFVGQMRFCVFHKTKTNLPKVYRIFWMIGSRLSHFQFCKF